MVLRWTAVTVLPIASDGKQDKPCFTKMKPEGTDEMKKKKKMTMNGTESAAEP